MTVADSCQRVKMFVDDQDGQPGEGEVLQACPDPKTEPWVSTPLWLLPGSEVWDGLSVGGRIDVLILLSPSPYAF